MKKFALLIFALGLAVTTFAQSAPKADERKPAEQAPPKARPMPTSPAQVYHNQLRLLEHEMVEAAEAMPGDKFDFKPDPNSGAFADSRTFKQQIGHVAVNNFSYASALTGDKFEVGEKELDNGPVSRMDKASTIRYLKDSFAAAHKAVDTINISNLLEPVELSGGKGTRLTFANIFLWHGFDHYGQMALYLRMNNIVPPASRPRQ